MLDRSLLASYLDLKQRIAAAISVPESGFVPSQRHASEGLAKHLEIGGESWTYATHPGGYAFTNARRRFMVVVSEDDARNRTFTAPELLAYLGAFTVHENLNQLVVDMWLVRAEMAGLVQPAEGLRGHWRLAP